MSQITNVVTTEFRGRAGQAIATMGQVGRSFQNLDRNISQTTRMSEQLGKQWKAIGTTIRYAIAGQAVFGIASMVTQLREVQVQMGLIAATADLAGGGTFSSGQLTRLSNELQSTAMKSLTPLKEVNDATLNFLSTVQGVNPSEIPSIIESIGRAAKLSKTPVEELTKAASGMNIAFGMKNNAQNIGQFNNMWWNLIATAPGGQAAAPQIAQQLPSLASMFMLAPGQGVTGPQAQAQLMGLTLGAVRTGAPPSVAMRGLTYLLQSIAQPTPQSAKALAAIGVTPEAVSKEGIFVNLMKVLKQITPVTKKQAGQIGMIPEESESEFLPGIPADEMAALRKQIPRIHGVRAAVILASQMERKPGSDVASIAEDVANMEKAQRDQLQGTKRLSVAWQKLAEQAPLEAAAISVDVMRTQFAQAYAPVLNLGAQGISGAAGIMNRHPEETKWAARGGAVFLAAMGIGKMTGLAGRLPKIPGISRVLGGSMGQGFVNMQAAQAALSGDAALGASPQNPLYVTVVGQIFGGGTRGPGGGGSVVDDVAGGAAGGAAGSKLKSILKFGGKVAGARIPFAGIGIGLGTAAAAEVALLLSTPGAQGKNAPTALRRAQELFGQRGMGAPVTGIAGEPEKRMIKGVAHVFLTLERTDAAGRVIKQKVHVPVELFTNGNTPTQKGNTKGRP